MCNANFVLGVLEVVVRVLTLNSLYFNKRLIRHNLYNFANKHLDLRIFRYLP